MSADSTPRQGIHAPTPLADIDLSQVSLIASDIDGTLLSKLQPIPQRTVEALSACSAAGVHIVLVTGRPPRWLDPIREQLSAVDEIICANGAVVLDARTGETARSHPIAGDAVSAVVAAATESLPGVWAGFETASRGLLLEDGYPMRRPEVSETIDRRAACELDDIVKILLRCPDGDSDALLARFRAALEGVVHATHSNPRAGLVELSALGVTKAHTLAEIASSLGAGPGSVAAFGDMPNDVEMLQWAGLGFAMADGHPQATAVADAVCPSVLDGGTAEVLEAIAAARS